MSKNRSKWKNGPDGKTVRRNSVAEFYTSRPVELIASPALRVLSKTAHLALLRIELELRQHAGRQNGKLIVTKQQFVEFSGVHPRLVAPALRELEALGIIIVTERGRGGNAEHRQPNRFRLNYLCGAVDDQAVPTNSWKRYKTLVEAEQIAQAARAAKDPKRVAYGRQTGHKRNNSRGHLVYPKSGPLSVPETAKFSGPLSVPTGPGPLSVPTSDISGGGGEEADVASSRSSTPANAKRKPARLPKWTTPQMTEIPCTPELRRLYCEAIDGRDACAATERWSMTDTSLPRRGRTTRRRLQ
jgi:hypothetical protein